MEPAQTEVIINYVVYSKVLEVKWMNNPDGYFVHFEGSRESINFGTEPPQWDKGDRVKITFERVRDATQDNQVT